LRLLERSESIASPVSIKSARRTWSSSTPRKYRFTLPAQLVGSGGVNRRVAPAGQPVATQLPRYGGFRSANDLGDSADRSDRSYAG